MKPVGAEQNMARAVCKESEGSEGREIIEEKRRTGVGGEGRLLPGSGRGSDKPSLGEVCKKKLQIPQVKDIFNFLWGSRQRPRDMTRTFRRKAEESGRKCSHGGGQAPQCQQVDPPSVKPPPFSGAWPALCPGSPGVPKSGYEVPSFPPGSARAPLLLCALSTEVPGKILFREGKKLRENSIAFSLKFKN